MTRQPKDYVEEGRARFWKDLLIAVAIVLAFAAISELFSAL